MCLSQAGSGMGIGADLGRRRTCWVMTRPKLSSALVISLLSAGEVYDGASQARLRRGSRSLNYLNVQSTWHHRPLWKTLMRRVWSDLLWFSLTDLTCSRCSWIHVESDCTRLLVGDPWDGASDWNDYDEKYDTKEIIIIRLSSYWCQTGKLHRYEVSSNINFGVCCSRVQHLVQLVLITLFKAQVDWNLHLKKKKSFIYFRAVKWFYRN